MIKAPTIQEMQGESTSSITALFGSLDEYESTLKVQSNLHGDVKKKSLALVISEKERDNDYDNEDEAN